MNNKGQSIFEFILFLPIILGLYFLTVTFGNAINGSINQQKVTRGYFYARAINGSNLPKPIYSDNSWRDFGMYWVGFKESFVGQTPKAPCYKIPGFAGQVQGSCDRSYTSKSTHFIRVETVYGICGATYSGDRNFISLVSGPGSSSMAACQIQ